MNYQLICLEFVSVIVRYHVAGNKSFRRVQSPPTATGLGESTAIRPRRPRRRPWPLTNPNVGVVVSFALISKRQWMERHIIALCTSAGELLFVVCCCFGCCCLVVCLFVCTPKDKKQEKPLFHPASHWRPRRPQPPRPQRPRRPRRPWRPWCPRRPRRPRRPWRRPSGVPSVPLLASLASRDPCRAIPQICTLSLGMTAVGPTQTGLCKFGWVWSSLTFVSLYLHGF